jgi:uncharacterized glyoxalase superfamily protein PhnB
MVCVILRNSHVIRVAARRARLIRAFWAKTFGMLTDRFGVSWAVNGEPIAFQ